MARIKVCDICLASGKLVRSNGGYSLKRHRELTLDYCNSCGEGIPVETNVEYAQYVYRIKYGVDLTEEQAKQMLSH